MNRKKIINIKNLKAKYGNIEAIKGIDFKLYNNEIVGIIGESGSGKTTLAKFILGINNIVHYTCDEYIINNYQINNNLENIKELYGNTISMTLQNPFDSLNPTIKIGTQIRILLKEYYKNISKDEINEKIKQIFKEINIKNYQEVIKKYPAELSGGMNQRINIAMSLIKEPKILIMDEPTSAIDEDNRKNLLELIKKIKEHRNLSVIFITHDILLAKIISDRLVLMKDGLIIEETTKEKEFSFKSEYAKELYKSALLENNSSKKGKKTKLLNFNNVSKSFNNNKIIDNISFTIYKNDIFGIIGESGSGKTTICKMIMNIYKPSSGLIELEKNSKVEMVYQNASTSIDCNQSIYNILNEENIILKKEKHSIEEIKKYTKDFNLPENVLNLKTNSLSGGQKQIISIIRALLNKPDLIILDEPTSSLDATSQKKMLDLLIKIKEKYNLTYIIISHDLKVIDYMCNRFININK